MMELDEGEAEAIVLALEESADLILLDDYEARKVARSFGLSITGITGTVGILIRAKREGRESLKDETEKLMKTGFWLNRKLNRKLYERIVKEFRDL